MRGRPADFWGKLSSDRDRWHPLVDHSADVAACCEVLLRTTLLRRRLAELAGLDDLSDSQVARLCVLATYHDLGKFNLGFQNKALDQPPFSPNGHVREALALFGGRFAESEQLRTSLALGEVGRWAPDGCALRLLVAAVAHHGKPADLAACEPTYRALHWRPARGLDPFAGLARLAGRARAWFAPAFAAAGDPLPTASAFQHAFSGLVTLADWLGSDTRFFPFSEDPNADRMGFARDSARRAVRSVGIDTADAHIAIGAAKPTFSMVSRFEPRAFQRSIVDLPAARGGSLAILEAETGSGKTEAALALFLSLFHAGEVNGLYFALPTRAAATQIHVRVRDAVKRAFRDAPVPPPVILGVPGYLRVDDREGRRLPDFEVLWNDDPDERRRYLGWAAENPKRYLAGAIAIGTVDQVLLSTLMVSHAHMRATSLLRLLLVVDEVHASDAYMVAVLHEVLANHLSAGGHALLMSATLGSAARHTLLSLPSLGAPPKALPLSAAERVPYPLLASCRRDSVLELHEPSSSDARNIGRELRPWADDYAAVARAALDAAAAGARVLVVRNTVSGCIATQQEVERVGDARAMRVVLFDCKRVVAPHHARFAATDRRDLDNAIEERFGKGSRFEPCVAVATQTMQQSLDIDADLLITDLCPMDVMLQRIGRLQRHSRARPESCAEPRVIVLTPAERDLTPMIRAGGDARGPHGFGTVYEDLRILEATWRALEAREVISIPAMNRTLVEETTHPEALRAVANSLAPAWRAHALKVSGSVFAMKRLAALNCIDRSQLFGDFEFPSSDLEQRIQTRLGEGDRFAQFDDTVAGPFGNPIDSLTIPAFLARGIDKDARPVLISANGSVVEFSFGPYRYVYDRLGLRRAADPSPESEVFTDG